MEKPKKEKLLLLIPEDKGDRKLSVQNYKIPTEYREKGIRCFQELDLSNVSIFLTDCQYYTFLLLSIIISDIFI